MRRSRPVSGAGHREERPGVEADTRDINLKGPEYAKARTKSDKIEIAKTDASKPKKVSKIAKKVDIMLNGTAIEYGMTAMEGCLIIAHCRNQKEICKTV